MKKKQKFGWLLPLFIVFIMVTSVFMYAFQGDDSYATNKYNGYKFTKEHGLWTTEVNGQLIGFEYFPTQVETLEVDPQVFESLKNTKQVYLTYDPESEFKNIFAQFQFSFQQFVGKHFNIFSVWGFTTENEFDKLIIDCNNATQFVPVIKLIKTNETMVEFDNNCIIVKVNEELDAAALRNRLYYGMFGII